MTRSLTSRISAIERAAVGVLPPPPDENGKPRACAVCWGRGKPITGICILNEDESLDDPAVRKRLGGCPACGKVSNPGKGPAAIRLNL